MERTALRTNSTSTSEAYLIVSARQQRVDDREELYALLELSEDLLDVLLVGESVDDFEFGQLDVDRIVVLAEEHLDVVAKDQWPTLNDEEDVSKSDVLDFVAGREKSDCAM